MTLNTDKQIHYQELGNALANFRWTTHIGPVVASRLICKVSTRVLSIIIREEKARAKNALFSLIVANGFEFPI